MISNRTAAFAVAALCLSFGSPARADAIEQLKPAVAQVISASGVGTGFLIRSDGVFVTAYHVVSGGERAWAHFPGGTAVEIEGLLRFDPVRDFAIVRLKSGQLPAGLRPVPLCPKVTLKSAQPVVTIGYPRGGPQKVTRGAVLAPYSQAPRTPSADLRPERSSRHGSRIQFDAPIAPGSSGSPLLTPEGEAVGVVVSHLRHSHPVGYAVDITSLLPIPDASSGVVSFADASSQADSSPEGTFSRALGVLRFWSDRRGESDQATGPVFRFDGPSRPDTSSPEHAAVQWALEGFEKVVRERPEFAEAHFSSALCYWYLDRRKEALAAIRKVAALWPDNVVIQECLTDELISAGRWDAAEAKAAALVRSSPSFTPGRRLLARCLARRKQFARAAAELEAASRVRPRDVQIRLELARVRRLAGNGRS